MSPSGFEITTPLYLITSGLKETKSDSWEFVLSNIVTDESIDGASIEGPSKLNSSNPEYPITSTSKTKGIPIVLFIVKLKLGATKSIPEAISDRILKSIWSSPWSITSSIWPK